MTLFQQLSDEQTWKDFLLYKAQCGNMTPAEETDLVHFVARKEYLPVVERMGSDRKRVVYTYPREENYVLKLLTYLLLRKYEYLFAPNLYSFRVHHGVNEAIKKLKHDKKLSIRHVYKVDIHDYFNSVDVDLIIPQLEVVLKEDKEVLDFIKSVLLNKNVKQPDGSIVEERKGIMAGIPLSAFLANLYLRDMDWHFENAGKRYLRYSDDIIIFENSAKARERSAKVLLDYLREKHLEVNPKKEMRADPGEEWTFLGVKFKDGLFDISDASVTKICGKMRRKYRALIRWRHRKALPPEKAAKAFVKVFNRKLYENQLRSDLTWTRWFFPIIDTTSGLRRIDSYMQQCVRYIMTETRTKRNFNCRYSDIKELGYRSLVHEYYKHKEETNSTAKI